MKTISARRRVKRRQGEKEEERVQALLCRQRPERSFFRVDEKEGERVQALLCPLPRPCGATPPPYTPKTTFFATSPSHAVFSLFLLLCLSLLLWSGVSLAQTPSAPKTSPASPPTPQSRSVPLARTPSTKKVLPKSSALRENRSHDSRRTGEETPPKGNALRENRTVPSRQRPSTKKGLLKGSASPSSRRSRWSPAEQQNRDPRNLQKVLRPRRLALLVGIDRYRNTHWPALRFASRDARQMHRHLQRYGRFDRLLLLRGSRQTTRAAIIRAIRSLRRLNTSPNDTIVVYISAHGTIAYDRPHHKPRRYVVTSDTGPNIPATALSVRWLRQQLSAFPSRRKLLMLATCYTGDSGSKSRLPQGYKGAPSLQAIQRSRTMLILSAASMHQPAFESQELRGDVYTHYFLSCLRKLAQQPKTLLSASQVHACAVDKTFRYVQKKFGQHQLPGLESRIDGLDAVYLAGQPHLLPSKPSSRSKRAVVQLFHGLLSRWKVRFFRRGQKGVAAAAEQPGELLLILPAGPYRVVLHSREAGLQRELQLLLRPGERAVLKKPPPALRLELAGGVWGAPLATVPLHYGASATLSWSLLALRLSYATGRGEYTTTFYQQHLLDLRLEVAWRPRWGSFQLDLGGYLGGGLLLQAHADGLHWGPLLTYGALVTPALALTPRLTLTLPLDAGFLLVPLGRQLKHLFGWSARLGLRYRF